MKNNNYIRCPYIDCHKRFSVKERRFRVNPTITYIENYKEIIKQKEQIKLGEALRVPSDKENIEKLPDIDFYFNLDEEFDDIDKNRHLCKQLKSYTSDELKCIKGIRLNVNNVKSEFVESFTDMNNMTSNKVICPHCNRIIHEQMGLIEAKTMPIIGVPNSGKTAYLISLEENLSKQSGNAPEKYLHEIRRATNKVKDAKDKNVYPHIFNINGKGLLVTYNLAGEGFADREYLDNVIRPIMTFADGVLVLIPPHKISALNIEAPPRTKGEDIKDVEISELLDNVCSLIPSGKNSVKMLVGLNMLDRLEQKWKNMMTNNDNNGLSATQLHRISVILNNRSIRGDYKDISMTIQDFLLEILDNDERGKDIINPIQKLINNKNVRFFGLQIGPKIGGFKFMPYGILAPLRWLFE